MQRVPSLFIANAEPKGRGVYTASEIPLGSIIEICPVLEIPKEEVEIIHNTELHDYYFVWGNNDEMLAIALGYGSLYNHEYDPNANFILDLVNKTIEIVAIKDIISGEEITINYHGEPLNNEELWFDQKGQRVKRIKAN
ncbi:MAG: SET domain-containing protein [Bacteroidota bacterium]|nr:SET domain-containing protein [Bacteroidota bacterium]